MSCRELPCPTSSWASKALERPHCLPSSATCFDRLICFGSSGDCHLDLEGTRSEALWFLLAFLLLLSQIGNINQLG